jgi:hypothetical protein
VKKFPPPLKNYLKNLRKNGYGEMVFDMDENFQEIFNLKEKKVIFKEHRDIDLFYLKLIEIEPEFEFKFKFEYFLLKTFDRAFWMRHFKEKNNRKYCPYHNDDVDMGCPFDNPENTSMIKFEVKF